MAFIDIEYFESQLGKRGLFRIADIIGGITAVSIANPSEITTDVAHGLSSGDTVDITNVGTTPDINGQHVITVTGASTFTIPVNVTAVADGVGDWRLIVTNTRARGFSGFKVVLGTTTITAFTPEKIATAIDDDGTVDADITSLTLAVGDVIMVPFTSITLGVTSEIICFKK